MFDIIELVERKLQAILDSGEVECPASDCDNRQFSVSIWRDEENGLVGDASCRNCDLRIELDLDDETVGRAESTLEALQSRDRAESPVDSAGVETAE